MKILLIFSMILLVVPVFAQDGVQIMGRPSEPGLRAVVFAAPVFFPFNGGPASVVSQRAAIGLSLEAGFIPYLPDFNIVSGVTGDVNVKNGDGENWSIDWLGGVFAIKGVFFGLGKRVAEEGVGVLKFNEGWGFTAGLNFLSL